MIEINRLKLIGRHTRHGMYGLSYQSRNKSATELKSVTVKSEQEHALVSRTPNDFQALYEGEIWCLCTLAFGQKGTKLNSRLVYCSKLYGKSIITAQQLVLIRIVGSMAACWVKVIQIENINSLRASKRATPRWFSLFSFDGCVQRMILMHSETARLRSFENIWVRFNWIKFTEKNQRQYLLAVYNGPFREVTQPCNNLKAPSEDITQQPCSLLSSQQFRFAVCYILGISF